MIDALVEEKQKTGFQPAIKMGSSARSRLQDSSGNWFWESSASNQFAEVFELFLYRRSAVFEAITS